MNQEQTQQAKAARESFALKASKHWTQENWGAADARAGSLPANLSTDEKLGGVDVRVQAQIHQDWVTVSVVCKEKNALQAKAEGLVLRSKEGFLGASKVLFMEAAATMWASPAFASLAQAQMLREALIEEGCGPKNPTPRL
jgi:hypothetical protein